jgi:acetamidase/formamidase
VVLTIQSGEEVVLDTPDASNGELSRSSTKDDIALIDYRKLDPLVGPIYVEDAKPGDVLKITVKELKTKQWGWCALLPDFGLLADEITDPYYKVWELDQGSIEMPNGSAFELKPMIGCIGVAPGVDGDFATITPTNAAGNIDVRYLNQGAELYVPIFTDGALLSAADGHALQGEGEISGTAIECPMEMTLKVELMKNVSLDAPELVTYDTFPAQEGYRIFTGIGPDLMEAAKDATRRAIGPLAKAQKISEVEAYALFGILAELRIHEIVDIPHWVVGCMLPLRLFK